jgi:hypothetical protein
LQQPAAVFSVLDMVTECVDVARGGRRHIPVDVASASHRGVDPVATRFSLTRLDVGIVQLDLDIRGDKRRQGRLLDVAPPLDLPGRTHPSRRAAR